MTEVNVTMGGRLPIVLYEDYNGFFEPLSRLYWSSSSRFLVSRHPCSSIEEVLSSYCPQCLTRYMDDEVSSYENRCPSCFQCPRCESILTMTTAIVATADNSNISNQTKALSCGFCSWRSDKNLATPLIGDDKASIEASVIELERDNPTGDAFKAILGTLKGEFNNPSQTYLPASMSSPRIPALTPTSSSSSTKMGGSTSSKNLQSSNQLDATSRGHDDDDNELRNNDLGDNRWRLQDVEAMLEARSSQYNAARKHMSQLSLGEKKISTVPQPHSSVFTTLTQRLQNEKIQSILCTSAMPTRVRLKTKRTVRCRHDVENSKMSILVQPKSFPLEGDSSLKVQRGKWWVKDSSAVHEVPSIVITKLPVFQSMGQDSTNTTSQSNNNNINNNYDKVFTSLHLKISNPKDTDLQITFSPALEEDWCERKRDDINASSSSSSSSSSSQATTTTIKRTASSNSHHLTQHSKHNFSIEKILAEVSHGYVNKNVDTNHGASDLNVKIVKVETAKVGNESNSLQLTLAAFEDELLRDPDQSEGSKAKGGGAGTVSNEARGDDSGDNTNSSSSTDAMKNGGSDVCWTCTTSNNVANIVIPLTLSPSEHPHVKADTNAIASLCFNLCVLANSTQAATSGKGGGGVVDIFKVVIAFPFLTRQE